MSNLPLKLQCTFSPAEQTCISSDALLAIASLPQCRVYMTTGQMGVVTGGPIVFDTVETDNAGLYDPTTGLFTIPENGVYSVTAQWTNAAIIGGDDAFGMAASIPPYPVTSPSAQDLARVTQVVPAIGSIFPSVDMSFERNFSTGDTFSIVISTDLGPVDVAGLLDGSPAPMFPGFTWASVRKIA